MLTTTTRFIQAIDPNAGVTRARTCAATAAVTANVWSELGRKAMTKVDFHDRWPLHSTS